LIALDGHTFEVTIDCNSEYEIIRNGFR